MMTLLLMFHLIIIMTWLLLFHFKCFFFLIFWHFPMFSLFKFKKLFYLNVFIFNLDAKVGSIKHLKKSDVQSTKRLKTEDCLKDWSNFCSFVFRSNFLRLCILKVTQQSEKHLDKILNVDEFLKRIYSVMYSNDPVARAITVRVFGSIACIVSERKNVHHR